MSPLRAFSIVLLAAFVGRAGAEPPFDERGALEVSQAAIGNVLDDYRLTDRLGRPVSLAQYRGRPLVISMVYTSCAHICALTTRALARGVEVARDALGADSFEVVTIGFDVARDTPEAMADFARLQGIAGERWKFLSADPAAIEGLTRQIGFVYHASPKGFDHLLQATLVDGEGRVHQQLYGQLSQPPQLVEPLKQLVLGVKPDDGLAASIGKRVRLFCTAYDPASGRYYFDYSLFIGMAIGLLIIGVTPAYLVREMRRGRSSPAA